MSVMLHCYSVIIDRGISASGHGKEVVGGLNDIDQCYTYQLISNVQLTGSKGFYSQMHIHTSTQNKIVSLAKEYQNICIKIISKNGVIDQGK